MATRTTNRLSIAPPGTTTTRRRGKTSGTPQTYGNVLAPSPSGGRGRGRASAPGQVKKRMGLKSAKSVAPGQRKKNPYAWRNSAAGSTAAGSTARRVGTRRKAGSGETPTSGTPVLNKRRGRRA